MNSPVNNTMIKLARMSRGLTQPMLARKLNIVTLELSKVEMGLLRPMELDDYCSVLKYRRSLFFLEADEYPTTLSANKRLKLKRRTIDKYRAISNIIAVHMREVADSSSPIELISKRDFWYKDSIDAAHLCNEIFTKLTPYDEDCLISCLECAGFLVKRLCMDQSKIDGFFLITGYDKYTPPIFFLESCLNEQDSIFALARELGNFVLNSTDSDKAARKFAVELLSLRDWSLGNVQQQSFPVQGPELELEKALGVYYEDIYSWYIR